MSEAASEPDADSRTGGQSEHPVRAVLGIRAFQRVLIAFFIFNTLEWATWIAILVWAFDTGGAGAAGLIAVVQLVPATLAAPLAGTLGDRMRRDRALALGYLIQVICMVTVGVALLSDAPAPWVYVTAALAATSIVLTRPVHSAIVSEIAQSPSQITAGHAASSTAEGIAVFAGPLLAGALLGWLGPSSVFLGASAAGFVSVLLTYHLPLRRSLGDIEDPQGMLKATAEGLTELRRDSGALLLTLIVGVQFMVGGMLDILTIELGINILDMGPSGPGILASALGIGGLLGAMATLILVGRRRLTPAMLAGMCIAGAPIALVALASVPPVAWLLLAAAGAGNAFVDVAGRTLLQRVVRAHVLARIFGAQESLRMAGMAVGAVAAPVLVQVLGGPGAFVVAGVLLPAVGILSWVWMRQLDERAVQPGVGFPLLESIPMFSVLPQDELEQLSRELIPVSVPAGTDIVVQGERGDRFYVLAEGTVTVIRANRVVARTEAGGYFGEIALLRDIPRTATVRADTDVSLFALEREVFLDVVAGASSIREIADEETERRLRDLESD